MRFLESRRGELSSRETANRKKRWRSSKVRRQMYLVYLFVVLIPIAVVGLWMISYVKDMLSNHYLELLEAENNRVKTFFTELTTQIYNVSDDICYNRSIKTLLSGEYENASDFSSTVNQESGLDSIIYETQGMENIFIYTDNPTISNYKQYRAVTEEIEETEWYQRAFAQNGAFWISLERQVNHVSKYNLCLVRRMNLSNSDYHAVILILISDDYIRMRIDASVIDAVSVDDSGVVYSSRRSWYGENIFDVDRELDYYSYSGPAEIRGKQYLASVTAMTPYMTNSDIYIYTFSSGGFEEITGIIRMFFLILVFALGVPGLILLVYTTLFSSRVSTLREEIHRASNQDYELQPVLHGNDELAQAYGDLQVMVQTLKEKDNQMYEAKLKEKELLNEQQMVEYKMLASQINPHFLYNTLETIRMMSLADGNRDVAAAVRTLGKTLRYVLDNTGTTSTKLSNELAHIENYLTIQKMRFGERINYQLVVEEGIDTADYQILPLLLQPVVENAVVHGLEGIEEKGMITMGVRRNGEEALVITVADNGLGMTAEKLEEVRRKLEDTDEIPQTSIGLYNISRRIRLCYGSGYGIRVDSVPGEGTEVTITIPGES